MYRGISLTGQFRDLDTHEEQIDSPGSPRLNAIDEEEAYSTGADIRQIPVGTEPHEEDPEMHEQRQDAMRVGGLVLDKEREKVTCVVWNFHLTWVSLLLFIVDLELFWNSGKTDSVVNQVLRGFISIMTIMMAICISRFHYLQHKLEILKTVLPPSIAFPASGSFRQLCVEFAVTIIHIPPGLGCYPNLYLLSFLRMIHIARYIKYESRLHSPSGKFLAKLCETKVNNSFVARTTISKRPVLSLVMLLLTSIILCSYLILVAERYDYPDLSFWDCLWLLYSATTTIGFGDVVPRTGLGRAIAAAAGIAGIIFTALLIALVHTSLQLNGQEAKMVSFLEKDRAYKRTADAAARLLQAGMTWAFGKKKKKSLRSQRAVVDGLSRFAKAREQDSSIQLSSLMPILDEMRLSIRRISRRVDQLYELHSDEIDAMKTQESMFSV